ncbi:hypothetical protein CspHIS471_0405460 [Cutaneotrichosporon sp. HIS471]|nr:hypothetical protein CspHIS471_0405460 [Cutaneotrichosporon sp. HIS471]
MGTSRPTMEARFSLPLLSAGGDLLPDPAAIARINRQASLPETPERALPIAPVPQCNITKPVRVFYEAREVLLQTDTTRSVSPGTVIEDAVFANSLACSMIGSGRSQQPSTPLRGEYSQELEYQPYGYQAQSYSPVPGFNPKYRKVSTTPTFEMDTLQANASQPSSPPPSPGMLRHHGYKQVPSESLLRSPLASPTASKSTSRSLRSSLRLPPSRSESRSVESHGSSLVKRAPGPFPWAASAPTTSPSHSASKYMSPVASPSRQLNHVIVTKDPATGQPDAAALPVNKPPTILAAPTSGLVSSTMTRVLNPPARSSSHMPAKDPQPDLRGPVAERRHLPLQAPKPITPPEQLLSQRAIMFNTFSESGDGHNSLSSRRQERQELSPWAPLSPVGHVADSDLTRHRKRLAESLSAPTHAWAENPRKDRRGG